MSRDHVYKYSMCRLITLWDTLKRNFIKIYFKVTKSDTVKPVVKHCSY